MDFPIRGERDSRRYAEWSHVSVWSGSWMARGRQLAAFHQLLQDEDGARDRSHPRTSIGLLMTYLSCLTCATDR